MVAAVVVGLWALTAGDAGAQVPLVSSDVPVPLTEERLGGAFGLGVSVGVPTGLTGKLWFGEESALQFGFGSRLGDHNTLVGTVDYVLQFRPINVEGDDYFLPLHAGGGVKVDVDCRVPGCYLLVGPRFPLGVSVLVPTLPLDFHVEVAPTIYLYEEVAGAVDGLLGFRYYF